MRDGSLNPLRSLEERLNRAHDLRLGAVEKKLDSLEHNFEEQLRLNEKRIKKMTGGQADRITQRLSLWHRSVHRRVGKVEELLERREVERDEQFYTTAASVIEEGRTMLGYEHLYTLWQAVRNVARQPGAWAEVGTYHGGTAEFLLEAGAAFGATGVEFHGFDLFDSPAPEYLPEEKRSSIEKKSEAVSLDEVKLHLARFPNVTLHGGDVIETLDTVPEKPWSLVHIDVNFKEPTLAALRYFGSRLLPGGVLVLDDYLEPGVPGVVEALTEWLDEVGSGWQRWECAPFQLVVLRLPDA